MTAVRPSQGGAFEWDDRLWAEVWERHLSPLERHALAMDLLHRRWPPDPFERSVVAELARQWRRTARGLAVLWAVWVLFWGNIAVTAPPTLDPRVLPWVMTALGLVVIAGAIALRRRVRGAAQGPPDGAR